MTRRVSVFLLATVAIVSGATMVSQAQPQTLLTRHQRQETLDQRTPLVGRLPANQTLQIQIILQHRNQAGLEQFLKEQQDPSSPNYRKVLTVEQFTEQYGPSHADYETVKSFVRQNGLEIVSGSRNRILLQVRGSVENIEKALHVNMAVYRHDTENRTFFAPDREPTPDLPFKLWHIGGLDNYATPKPAYHKLDPSEAGRVRSNATTGSGPDASFLGSDMRAAYYVNGNASATLTGTGQSLGLFEFIGTDLTDLSTYYTSVGQTNIVPITLTSVDTQSTSCLFSGTSPCDDTEQTIDMTQALGMAPGMSSLVMYIGTGGLPGQTLDDAGILDAMATADPLNPQLSCSWAWRPTDNTTDDPYFEEFLAQGQNLFVASGDDGSWADAEIVWPADDPYIVSVGGTDLTTSSAGGPWASETGWIDGGGGISPNQFPIPSWQVAAAAGCAQCSQTYRNGPDVAAEANFDFFVCADQEPCTANVYGGTSFATPMWAGYLALANEQYLTNTGGTSTLGFINPALYAIGGGSNYDTDFHDCLTGGNAYGCTVGFDLSTGWGSPNGNALVNALAGSSSTGPTVTVSPLSLKWGDTVLQETSTKKAVTLKNSGSSMLNISNIATSGDFGQTTSTKPCGSTLAAGKDCTIEVTFTPTQVGALSGTLTISDNAASSPQTVALSGTGEAQATLTPTSKTFPSEKVGTSSPASVFTLANKQSVELTSIVISTTGDFSISTKTCTASLAAKTTCTISVLFTPTATGTRTGTLQVSDSAVGSPQTSNLKGTGK